VSDVPTQRRTSVKGVIPLSRRTVARAYAVVAYACGVFLVWTASMLGDTHAAAWSIFVFLPGVVFAALSPSIWSGARWAMIVAFLVVAVLDIALTVNAPGDWWVVLVFPVVCGAFTLAHIAAEPTSDDSPMPPARVADEVYAALAYMYGILLAAIAPYDAYKLPGPPILSGWAFISGLVLGALSVFIWRGKVWAMAFACLLTLAQWLVLASLEPMFWTNGVYYAGPAVSALLTLTCVLTAKVQEKDI
jgi:hypothetical protein